MRHGSLTSRRDAAGVLRRTPGGSGHGTPCRVQPAGLGPIGHPSKVHSTGAAGAAVPHTVPQRSVTCVVNASP
jgi:hypothetical protein